MGQDRQTPESLLYCPFSISNPNFSYEVVVFGNRNEPRYQDRVTTTTLSDVRLFSNASSEGALFRGPDDPSVTIPHGYNTQQGLVARYTDVRPDDSGKLTLTLTGEMRYANAFYLKAE